MKRFAIAVALVATLSFTGSALALGPAPAGTAIASFDATTGEIVVSVDSVFNWYIASTSGQLDGPDNAAPPLPLSGVGGLATDNDFSVGETSITSFTYSDVSLGAITNPFAFGSDSNADGDLQIYWNDSLGGQLNSSSLQLIVPEPTTLALAGISVVGLLATRRRRMA